VDLLKADTVFYLQKTFGFHYLLKKEGKYYFLWKIRFNENRI